MKKHVLVALAAAAVLAGCSSDVPGGGIPPIKTPEFSSRGEAVNKDLNKFAFDFLNATAEEYENICPQATDENLSVSPLSASIALAMLANSGDDVCTAQVSKALGIEDMDALNETCNTLLRYLSWRENGEVLELVNAVWYDQDSEVKQSFRSTMTDTYYAPVSPLDFTNTPRALETINAWANEKTHGLIPKALGFLPDDTKFALANSMYYNGKWKTPFEKKNTDKMDFKGSLKTTSVDMMHDRFTGAFYQTDLASAISLPFQGNTNMMIVLPTEDMSIVELSKQFDFKQWSALLESQRDYFIVLDLPKFKVENSLPLNEVLKHMGINTWFESMDKMGLYYPMGFSIAATQVTSTSIDEEGAKAAAVTVITGDLTSPGPQPVDGVVEFSVDTPFMYFIYDTKTGTILMAGRVCNL